MAGSVGSTSSGAVFAFGKSRALPAMLLFALVCYPKCIRVQGSATDDATQSVTHPTTFYVAAWSEVAANPLSDANNNDDLASDTCGSRLNPCPSLGEALSAISEHRQSSGLSESSPQKIAVKMLANSEFECRVLIRRYSCTKKPRKNNKFIVQCLENPSEGLDITQVSDLILDGENNAEGCSRTTLVPPMDIGQQKVKDKRKPLLRVLGSSRITIRSIRLGRSYLAAANSTNHRSLLHVEFCSMIKLINCEFKSEHIWGLKRNDIRAVEHVKVVDSVFVIFSDCLFHGNPSQRTCHVSSLAKRGKEFNSPALAISYGNPGKRDLPEVKRSNLLEVLFDIDGFSIPDRSDCGPPQEDCSSSAGPCMTHVRAIHCFPTVLVFRCELTRIGALFERDSVRHDLRVRNPPAAIAFGLSVKLFLPKSHWVVVDHCTIAANLAPKGSPVVVEFNTHPPTVKRLPKDQAIRQTTAVHVTNTVFRHNVALLGGAMMVRFVNTAKFKPETAHSEEQVLSNLVLFENCTFLNNSAAKQGGAVVVHDNSRSPQDTLNCVQMNNVTFVQNSAHMYNYHQPGGAVSMFTMKPIGKSVEVVLRNFSDVSGTCLPDNGVPRSLFHDVDFRFNGGIGCVHLTNQYAHFSGVNAFWENNMSALVLHNSKLTFSNTLVMEGNLGTEGACFNLHGGSQVDLSQVSTLNISDNLATNYGSVAFADAASSTLSVREALYTREDTPSRRFPCPFILPNGLSNKSEQMEQLFHWNGNRWDKVTGVIFMSSVFSCFEAYSALLPHLHEVENPRFCMPYPPATWDMIDSAAECDEDYCTVALQYSSAGPCLEGCAHYGNLTVPQRTGCMPSDSSLEHSAAHMPDTNRPEMYKVKGAPGGVQCLYPQLAQSNALSPQLLRDAEDEGCAESLVPRRGVCPADREACTENNAYFNYPADLCFAEAHHLFVINQPPGKVHAGGKQPPFATNPAWLVFSGASTSCYKMIGDDVWYFYQSCYRTDIVDRITEESPNKRLPLETDCTLFDLAQQYNDYNFQLPGVLPGYAYVLVPWSSLILSWNTTIGEHAADKTVCSQDSGGSFANALHSISDLTLHPAPGEDFKLRIDALDELFNVYTGPLSIGVLCKREDVLLAHGSFIVKNSQTVLFSSKEFIHHVSLLGVPGAKGYLVIRAEGDLTFSDVEGFRIELWIPFQLRKCHLGFEPISKTWKEAQKMAQEFTTASVTATVGYVNQLREDLTCRCRNFTNRQCVARCEQGKLAYINPHCWAGYQKSIDPIFTESQDQQHTIKAWISLPKETFVNSYESDPIGFMERNNSFAAEPCLTGTCAAHKREAWLLGKDNPCSAVSNAGGPLCTQCLAGFKRTMGSRACVKCERRPAVHLAVYFTALFLLKFILFTLIVLLNVGVLAPLDSWLFFSQAYFCIHGSSSDVSTTFTNFVTMGLGMLCIKEELSPMARQTAVMTTALMSFFLVAVFYVIGNRLVAFKRLQRLQRRRTIRHVLWLVILWSCTLLVYSAMTLLRPVRLGSRTVLFIDATVDFFEKQHLPYACTAIAIIVLFVLPTPVLLIWQPTHLFPSLIGFVDEATQLYEPSCRSWACFNIIRRIAFGVLMGMAVQGLYQRIAMAGLSIVLLAVHGYIRPFKRSVTLWKVKDADNTLEFVLLTLLSFLAVYQLVQVDVLLLPADNLNRFPFAVFGALTGISLAIYCYRFFQSWKETLAPKRDIVLLWRGCDVSGCHGGDLCRHGSQASEQESEAHNRCSADDDVTRSDMSATEESIQPHTGLREPLLMEVLRQDH